MPVEFVETVPLKRRGSALFLLPFPLERHTDLNRLAGRPFIGCGPAPSLSFAFRSGCLDYLRDPWTDEEFLVRIGRYFSCCPMPLGVAGIVLSEGCLKGPRGIVRLSVREEILLRLLGRNAGRPVDRVFLASSCGYANPLESRSFDVAVSKLRSRLAEVSDEKPGVQLLAIRGKGLLIAERLGKSRPVDKW